MGGIIEANAGTLLTLVATPLGLAVLAILHEVSKARRGGVEPPPPDPFHAEMRAELSRVHTRLDDLFTLLARH